MGEMSDYYSGVDEDPYEAYSLDPLPKLTIEKIKEVNNKMNKEKFVLKGYKNGKLFVDRELNLTDEQIGFFNIIGQGKKLFKITVEDAEEVHGWAHDEYEYFLEIV